MIAAIITCVMVVIIVITVSIIAMNTVMVPLLVLPCIVTSTTPGCFIFEGDKGEADLKRIPRLCAYYSGTVSVITFVKFQNKLCTPCGTP